MKRLFLFLLLCSITEMASAQYIETVHLKNGDTIRGIITEQTPNQNLKIQTPDGSIFVYNSDEIEKITKEMSDRRTAETGIQNKVQAAPFKSGYEGSADIGYSLDVRGCDEGAIGVSTSHGYRITPELYVGAGIGFNYFHASTSIGVPIFGDFKGYFSQDKVKPFLDFRIGYSVGDEVGLYLAPSFGVNIKKLDISMGYTYIEDIHSGLTCKIGMRF